MKVNLLLCDTFPGLIPQGMPSYDEMFTGLFGKAGCRETRVFNTWNGQLPQELNPGEAYVITGSNSDAYDDTPWIASLRRWIRRAAGEGCAMIGICFGHQAIAQALGGRVERSPKGWGVGIRISQIVDTAAREALGPAVSLIYNHHDQVTELPEGAVRIAESDFCPNDGFRIGERIYALQGHPEFPVEFERHWIENLAPDEPAELKARALASLSLLPNDGQRVADWLIRTLAAPKPAPSK